MTLMTNDLNDQPSFYLSPQPSLHLSFLTPLAVVSFLCPDEKIFYHDEIITGARGRGYGDTAEAPSSRLVPTTGRPLVL